VALLPVADALARILEHADPLPPAPAGLHDAHGRVLAEDLAARRTQPPADVSAMDGYAVRAADVARVPTTLKVIGEVAAGRPFDGAVGPGTAARIFTGGVVPAGADTIVIQERVTREGDVIVVEEGAPAGKHIRRAGLDFRTGEVLLRRGRLLSGRDVSLAAAMNYATLPVHRPPLVAVLATGDELVPPGIEPGPGQIVCSNVYAVMALARSEGAGVLDLGIVPDRVAETVAAIRKARESGADILVTSGGASVGDYDLVHKALAAEGLAVTFWKVAMRPGKPLMHGRLGDMHVLGLPGNPVSAFVGAALFLVPLIRRLSGRADAAPVVEPARAGADLPANDERADYMRATLTPGEDGVPVATPFGAQDSSMMQTLARADCLLIREPFAPALRAGTPCSVVKLAF
jgi:molybdopterin molybdotransferase